ncbi:MAG: hypothetical protein OSB46_12225 [Alphaproteobacteria bacterium]|nr:hypothetical protein [Alphaproteobacteria bacterium]
MFDSAAHVAELETAKVEMHRRFKEGEAPDSFSATRSLVVTKPKETSAT